MSQLGGGELESHLKVEHDGYQQQHSEHDTETSQQEGLASAALYNQGLRKRERERKRKKKERKRRKKERRKTNAHCIATDPFS